MWKIVKKFLYELEMHRLSKRIQRVVISSFRDEFDILGCPRFSDGKTHRIIVSMKSGRKSVYTHMLTEHSRNSDVYFAYYRFLRFATEEDITKYPKYS